MITKEDLEKVGIIYVGTKIYPHRFFIPQIGEHNLSYPYKIEDVYKKIYEAGYDDGINRGEENKTNEIKKVLNIQL